MKDETTEDTRDAELAVEIARQEREAIAMILARLAAAGATADDAARLMLTAAISTLVEVRGFDQTATILADTADQLRRRSYPHAAGHA